MLTAIVRVSLAHPRIVAALASLVVVLGAVALVSARFDVFPDFAPPHVLVQTESPGLDATQVEASVTRPLEGLLAGTEGVKTIRSTSSQGLSAIQVVFGRGGDPYRQRQMVVERLADSSSLLPVGVGPPRLSPLSSSMEYLLHFGFTSDRLSPLAMRDLVKWSVEPQILAVPGVAQAQLFGGAVRQRLVVVDPHKLAEYGFTLADVSAAVRRATASIGAGYVETPAQRIVIRVRPPGASAEELAGAVLGLHGGVPIRLADVAEVRDGAAPRYGAALIGGQPGILVETSTQYGANTLEVTRALEARLETLAPVLARAGLDYHRALLRPASFVENAISSLRNSLLMGAALVVALLVITLRDWRGALVSFGAIPLTLITSAWILESLGLSLNTMTLGGLVVALGVVVDDAVIDVENILRRRRSARESLHPAGTFLEASLEVRRPVLFATAAVAVAFLPIVMMSGLQGAFFRPLSVAFLLAVGLSLIVAMSVTPALCALTMTGHRPAPEARFLAALKRAQLRAILWLHGRPRVTMAAMVAAGAAGMVLLPLLGARLLPDFREDYLIAHASLRPGVALAETVRVGKRISHGLMGIPGVVSVAEQIGRAENGQDPDAPNKSEFELQIDPRAGGGVDRIEARIRRVFADFPNQLVEIYSVLAERIGETLSGQTAPFSIDVFGADLDTDDRVGEAIVRVLGRLPDSGTVRLGVPPQQVEMRLRLRPRALAVHGLQAADVLQAVDEAFQGAVVATVREADRGLPVVVRLKAGADPGALGRLMLRGADGTFTPLSSVARIDRELARSQIQHQDGLRRQVVVASPRSADLAGFERAARAAIAARVKLPAGIFLRYEGAAEAQRSAARELLLHSAAALVVIVLLLALAFGDARQVGLVLVSLPSTMIGGVAAVAATGATLTLGSMVGFVALFGMAGRNTILLVSHFDHLVQIEGQEWCLRTAMRGAEERLTPVLLTALSTGLALLPVAWQLHRPGHEIEGPMAVVILGGLVSSTLVSLLLVPPLSVAWLRYRPR